jgi:small subunit ribosomal protein S2
MSALPKFSIKDLMESGVHFGHRTMRWNPKMQPFIYGSRNNVHIIDLQKTAPLLHSALKIARDVASRNGRILFVATKRQASSIVAEAAERCGQYYVNHRWMGGMLTNWNTVSKSIKTLNELEEQLANPELKLNKKERLQIQRKVHKLELALGGIRRMGGKPDLIIAIDTRREKIAIQEAKKLNIPVAAVVDTNCDPDNIDFIVPGNDDSTKSIRLFADLFSEAILSGLKSSVPGEAVSSAKPKAANANKDQEETKEEAPQAKDEKKETKAKTAKKSESKKEEDKEAKKDTKAKKSTSKAKEKDSDSKEEKETTKKATTAKKPTTSKAKKDTKAKADKKEEKK